MRLLNLTAALAIIVLESYLEAYQPYHATVVVNTESATVGAPNLINLTSELSGPNIKALIPSYTPVSAAGLGINIRGIEANAFFPANSTTLYVNIPQTNAIQTFTADTREDSLILFREYIRNAGNHHQILPAYAKYSPIDPIAGNPNSLMAQMAQGDYLLGKLSPLSGCDRCWSAQPIVHQFQTGLNAGRAFTHKYDTTNVTLPSLYSFSPDLNWALIIDVPFTYLRNGGASSVYGSLGFGIRVPLTHDWSLTPVVRAGAGGSLDLCTAGTFVSTGLTSAINQKVKDFVITMTNYAGYTTSTNLWLSGINFNYDRHNYILKNGLSLTTCDAFCLFDIPLNFNLSFIDSYFGGSRLYINHYDEIGINLIANCLNPYIDYDCLILGFSYQFGKQDYRGYFINLAYQF